MVKSELIAKIARKQDSLSIKDVELGVNHILECMSTSLGNGERIEVRGFGSFCLHYRPPRKAHNPKTGTRVYTEAKYTPHFKPGKDLRERVNASRGRVPITGADHVEPDSDDDPDSGSFNGGSTTQF